MLQNLELPAEEQARLAISPAAVLADILTTIAEPGTTWAMTQGSAPVPYKISYSELVPVAKFWYKFLAFNVLPSSHHTDVIIPRALLIQLIMLGVDIDICTILADSLYDTTFGRQNASLGHPALINLLCAEFTIDLPIAAEFVRDKNLLVISKFLPTPPSMAADSDEPAEPVSRGAGRGHDHSQYHALEQRMTTIEQRQDHAQAHLEYNQACMDALMSALGVQRTPGRFPPPPPPPAPAEPSLDYESAESASD